MKLVFLFFTSLVWAENVLEPRKSSENLSNAVVEILAKFWSNKQFAVNFLVPPEENRNFKFGDFIDDVARKSFVTQKIYSVDVSKFKLKNPKRSSLFLIERFEDFRKLCRSMNSNVFLFRGLFLIVLVGGEIPEIRQIFELLWQLQIYNVSVMFEDENGEVLVKTFMPFTEFNCSDTSPVLINSFSNGKFLNTTENFFPFKLQNLHNCPLRIATSNNAEPYIFAELLPTGNFSLTGRDFNLISTLSESLNFKIEIVFVGDEGFLLENGSATGPFAMLLENRADLIVADYWLKMNRLKFIDYTKPYISQQIAFVIPPGSELTSIEKFIKPLDTFTWSLLLLSIVSAVLVIRFVGKSSIETRNLVFGVGVKTPNLNLVIAVLGGNIRPEPRNNFARYLLMLFLLFCLIMRSLYQGSLFRFIQSKVNHKEVQSIEQMLDRNFKFFTVSSILDLLEGQSKIYQRLTITFD
jgi:hypothetical protein